MRILLMTFVLLVSQSFAADVMKCYFGNYNPTYELSVSGGHFEYFQGQLDQVISGFVGTERTSLGNDNLIFRLNPSSCELKVLSKQNFESQLTMRLALRSKTEGMIPGSVAGSLFGSHEMRCEVSSSVALALENVCDQHGSLDTEAEFDSWQGLMNLWALDQSHISNVPGVKIAPTVDYPVYQQRVFRAIHE